MTTPNCDHLRKDYELFLEMPPTSETQWYEMIATIRKAIRLAKDEVQNAIATGKTLLAKNGQADIDCLEGLLATAEAAFETWKAEHSA